MKFKRYNRVHRKNVLLPCHHFLFLEATSVNSLLCILWAIIYTDICKCVCILTTSLFNTNNILKKYTYFLALLFSLNPKSVNISSFFLYGFLVFGFVMISLTSFYQCTVRLFLVFLLVTLQWNFCMYYVCAIYACYIYIYKHFCQMDPRNWIAQSKGHMCSQFRLILPDISLGTLLPTIWECWFPHSCASTYFSRLWSFPIRWVCFHLSPFYRA